MRGGAIATPSRARCLTSPDARAPTRCRGSDVAGMQAYAERRGDEYVISGTKTFISNASEAAFFVVFARTDRESRP